MTGHIAWYKLQPNLCVTHQTAFLCYQKFIQFIIIFEHLNWFKKSMQEKLQMTGYVRNVLLWTNRKVINLFMIPSVGKTSLWLKKKEDI